MNTHEWEQLAQLDPLWAILSDKQKQHISKKDIPVFLSDSLRILKERGVVVFQLPSFIPLRNRILRNLETAVINIATTVTASGHRSTLYFCCKQKNGHG